MWQRLTLTDVRIIIHYLGSLILGSCIIMMPSLIVAIIFDEWAPALRYLTAIGIALILGSIMSLAYIKPEKLNRQQAIGVTALAWIVLSLLAAIPLFYSGHYLNYLDAVFDSVSAFTTTGATLVVDLNHLSYADNMMRFMMCLTGGLGIIVVALSLGIFGKGTSAALFTGEGRSEHVIPNIVLATRFILRMTLIVIAATTLILTCIMALSGLEFSRAILHGFWLAITSFVTAGVTPMSDSLMYYNNLSLEVVCMIIMIVGAISFTLFYFLFKGKTLTFFKDLEVKTAIIWMAVMTFVFTSSATNSQYFNSLPALVHRGTFTLLSAFTTTGLSVVTQNQLSVVFTSGAFVAIALIMAVGASAGSTAGGIKLERLGIICKSILLSIKQAISPNTAKISMHYYHGTVKVLDPVVVKNAMTIFILFVMTYIAGMLAGIACGYDAKLSLFESIALTSNTGITCGIAVAGMPVSLEIGYIILMWAGRLEFLALLSFFAQIIASLKPRRRSLKKESKIKQIGDVK